MINKNLLRDLEYRVTGACIEVHKALGPGLLESIYQKCLCRELELLGVSFTSEQILIVTYKGLILNTELRAS